MCSYNISNILLGQLQITKAANTKLGTKPIYEVSTRPQRYSKDNTEQGRTGNDKSLLTGITCLRSVLWGKTGEKTPLISIAQSCFKGWKIEQQVTRLNCENVSKEMAAIEIHKHVGSCRRARSDHRCSQARTATTRVFNSNHRGGWARVQRLVASLFM